MDERDWLILKTLHEKQSITKSAEELYISQPALTARIKNIESYLNTKLIKRTNKGIVLTDAGEFAVQYAEKQIDSMNRFKKKLAKIQMDLSGTLSVAAHPVIARYFIPNCLREFNALYPHIHFDIMESTSSDAISKVKSGVVQIGFVNDDLGRDKNEQRRLMTDSVSIVFRKPFSIKELPKMDLIDYESDNYYRHFLDTWWQANFSVKPQVCMKVSNPEICKEMVYQGLGYGILPTVTVANEKDLFSIKLTDEYGNLLERSSWIIYKKNIMEDELMKAFMEYLQAKING